MPHVEPLGPAPDKANPEKALRDQIISDTADRLEAMVAALKSGDWNPVRALFMIETYAATSKAHIAELVDSPLLEEPDPMAMENDDGMGDMIDGYMGGGRRNRRLGARRAARAAVVHHGGGFGPEGLRGGPIEQMVGAIRGMAQPQAGRNQAAAIRELTEALRHAQEMEDEALTATIRAQLNGLLGVEPDVIEAQGDGELGVPVPPGVLAPPPVPAE